MKALDNPKAVHKLLKSFFNLMKPKKLQNFEVIKAFKLDELSKAFRCLDRCKSSYYCAEAWRALGNKKLQDFLNCGGSEA